MRMTPISTKTSVDNADEADDITTYVPVRAVSRTIRRGSNEEPPQKVARLVPCRGIAVTHTGT